MTMSNEVSLTRKYFQWEVDYYVNGRRKTILEWHVEGEEYEKERHSYIVVTSLYPLTLAITSISGALHRRHDCKPVFITAVKFVGTCLVDPSMVGAATPQGD